MTDFFEYDDEFHKTIKDWVASNATQTYYLYASQQSDIKFESFCKAVISEGKIPIMITNVGKFDGRYSQSIQSALGISDDVRVYEVAKMGLMVVLQSRAKLFIETNGGILWTQ
jgi:hypothetical protein